MAVATPAVTTPTVAARLAALDRALGALPLDEVPVGRAPEVIEVLGRIERRVAAARVRLGRRVAQSGLPAASGDRDAASLAARLSGSSVGRARSELELAECRLAEGRHLGTWTPPEGGVRLCAHLSSVQGARVLAALAKKTDELAARAHDTIGHLRADALVALVCGEGVRTEVVVRATAAALVRGATEHEETCEIDGVGPVAVGVARSLLGEAFLTVVVADGADISTVTATS